MGPALPARRELKIGKQDFEVQVYPGTEAQRPSKPSPRPVPRRAKIICTIGPACNTEAAMRDLLRLGMDVARLNFSHGTHEDHAHNITRLRRAAEREGRTVCILQDLQGPKIRTGPLERHAYGRRRTRLASDSPDFGLCSTSVRSWLSDKPSVRAN